MDINKLLKDFLTVFTVSLVVSVVVTFLWSLIFHQMATIDWETSFRFATLLGVVLPLVDARRNK